MLVSNVKADSNNLWSNIATQPYPTGLAGPPGSNVAPYNFFAAFHTSVYSDNGIYDPSKACTTAGQDGSPCDDIFICNSAYNTVSLAPTQQPAPLYQYSNGINYPTVSTTTTVATCSKIVKSYLAPSPPPVPYSPYAKSPPTPPGLDVIFYFNQSSRPYYKDVVRYKYSFYLAVQINHNYEFIASLTLQFEFDSASLIRVGHLFWFVSVHSFYDVYIYLSHALCSRIAHTWLASTQSLVYPLVPCWVLTSLALGASLAQQSLLLRWAFIEFSTALLALSTFRSVPFLRPRMFAQLALLPSEHI